MSPARIRCALCNRVTLHPAVFIGAEPVGPSCARKANLLPLARRKGSRVTLGGHRSATAAAQQASTTLELFPETEQQET